MMRFSSISLLLLIFILVDIMMVASFAAERVLTHERDPDPNRGKYIWNPFLGFCGDNSTMAICSGVCPETCAFKSLNCPRYCGVNCECLPGYVFSEQHMKCILRSDCPSTITQEVVEAHRVFQ